VQASVLIPLLDRPTGVTVLLTHRAAHLSDHAGQISFPGGRAEASDRDAIETALREADEEIGLDARCVSVLGTLPAYTTVTRYVVTPVVGVVSPGFSLRIDPSEVSEVFEVPLAFLMSPVNHRRHAVGDGPLSRQIFSMPWVDAGADGAPRSHFIWGATAAMLRNLYRFLSI
jgi:8-oxo-dGTP pyrophosphatase MutT (NUDIX family)